MVQYSFREFVCILKYNGYELARTSGDHYIYKKDGRHISINKKPKGCVCHRLIKENNLILM